MTEQEKNLLETPIEGKTIYHGVIFDVEQHTVVLPNGKRAGRDIVRNPNAVAVVAVDEQGRVPMVRQYRLTAQRVMLEIPAGKMDAGEEPLTSGVRELREETGLTAEKMEYLFGLRVSPGFSTEIIHIYLATGLQQGDCDPDEDEFLQVEWMPLGQLKEMCLCGQIDDAKTVAGILAASERIQK